MCDSDSDYVDACEEDTDNVDNVATKSRSKPRINEEGIKVRGKDVEWVEIVKFHDEEEYKNSEMKKTLDKNFSRRKNRAFEYGDVENFICKFARKVGYLACPLKYKVIFISTSSEVLVECNDDGETHAHEDDPEHTIDATKQFRWSKEQTDIITEGVINHAKPNVIKRNLNNANVLGSNKPTKQQLYNKIASLKKSVFPSQNIVNTHDLRQRVAANLEVPENDIDGYIVYNDIDDENEEEEPRFTIIFSTKKNLSKMKSERVLQTDATYRLNWLGFPVFVVGTSSPTGKFFGSCVVLSSHEDTPAWSKIYEFMLEIGVKPSNHMGDGAKAISKAGREVFSDLGRCHRLMCWSHVHRNIIPQLKCITTHDKNLSANLLKDIVNLQWSVLNESSFRQVFKLLEQKYLNKHSVIINITLEKFFKYMRSVWVDSEEFRWYEGAHPWQVSNNQGVEGKNKEIKQSHTFRRRLELGELFAVMMRLVKEWSEDDDILLNNPRVAILHNDENALKMRTEGYQFYRKTKFDSDKILKINPKGKYTVSESEEFLLGKVDNLWSVDSSNDKSGRSLKERTKDRMENRSIPSSSTFDEYISMRSGCWIVEESHGDFFCDCPVGMKGKMCKHTVALMYKEGHLEQTSDVRSVPLGAKRRKGRPKQMPNCLAKSPIQQRTVSIIEDLDVMENITAVQVDERIVAPPVRKTTRKKVKKAAPNVEHGFEVDEDVVGSAPAAKKPTTRRKRKASNHDSDNVSLSEILQSPVQALLDQSRIQVGLGCSKPPKKKCRTGIKEGRLKHSQPASAKPFVVHPAKSSTSTNPCVAEGSKAPRSSSTNSIMTKPSPVNCKKKKGACNHTVAFGEHYNALAMKKYADHINSLSCTTVIDPNYIS